MHIYATTAQLTMGATFIVVAAVGNHARCTHSGRLKFCTIIIQDQRLITGSPLIIFTLFKQNTHLKENELHSQRQRGDNS